MFFHFLPVSNFPCSQQRAMPNLDSSPYWKCHARHEHRDLFQQILLDECCLKLYHLAMASSKSIRNHGLSQQNMRASTVDLHEISWNVRQWLQIADIVAAGNPTSKSSMLFLSSSATGPWCVSPKIETTVCRWAMVNPWCIVYGHFTVAWWIGDVFHAVVFT